MSYAIHYSDGKVEGGFDTTADALAAIEKRWPDYYAGHDGDLSEGGDRTLVWATEGASFNDDGRTAIASIRKEG